MDKDDDAFLNQIFSANIELEVCNRDFLDFNFTIKCIFCLNQYCKRGYFHWGKISRKCWQDLSRGGNFHDTAPFFFIESFGFNFREEVDIAKNEKITLLPPRENFHVNSN